MKKVLVTLTIALVTYLGYLYFFKLADDKLLSTSPLGEVHTNKLPKKTVIETNPNHIPKHQTIHTTDNTIKKIPSTHKRYRIFEEEDIDSVELTIKKIDGVTPVSALRMQKGIIQNIQVGDILILPVIDENTYEITITNRSVSKRGSVSIDGGFEEDGTSYSAILTENKNVSFISMHTPTGTYEIELFDGLGFIYRSSDIENTKIDYHKSDILNHP